jgi:hypothetical protein
VCVQIGAHKVATGELFWVGKQCVPSQVTSNNHNRLPSGPSARHYHALSPLALTQQVAQVKVPAPLRLAYDDTSKSIVVASMDLTDALESMAKGARSSSSLITSFDAASRRQRVQRAVETKRGTANMEGLAARGGYVLSGGYNSQVMVMHGDGRARAQLTD